MYNEIDFDKIIFVGEWNLTSIYETVYYPSFLIFRIKDLKNPNYYEKVIVPYFEDYNKIKYYFKYLDYDI